MIGIILIAVTWILLRLEGKDLGAIGLNAPRLRLREFSAGFLVAGAAAALQQFGYSLATGTFWRLNPDLSGALLLESLRWNTNSVLYEELLFRGYLLYQAIRLLGARRAVPLGAVAFGIYHWFSYGVLGNPVAMAFILLLTGAFGLMCALAFATTRSIAAPIGLHLGWNVISYVVFSAGPLGRAVLIPASGAGRLRVEGMAGLLLGLGLPMMLVAGVTYYLIRMRRGITASASS